MVSFLHAFPPKPCMCFHFSSMHITCSSHSIFLDLITL
jgi:hypothetical protein